MAGLFDYSQERAFAAELVAQIAKQLPPASMTGESMSRLSVNKITRSLERVYQEAGRHLSDHKMGLLRRSIFANAFKWSLREKGYPANFIDIATEGLVMEMTKTNNK